MTIDTLKVAKRLKEAGFNDLQAEAVVATVQESAEGADLATKSDLREMELRLEARIERASGENLTRVFGLILGALVINFMAVVGAMFGLAKLLGH